MLVERIFEIGGGLSIAVGVLLLAGLVDAGASYEYFDAYLAGGLGIGLGVFFLYVGRQARHDREALLRLGESSGGGAGPGAGPRRPEG